MTRLLAPAPAGPLAPRERPTLSVVIPYYRRADVIAEAVRSALEQTEPPHEIVICDDGSPDDLDGALGALRDRVTVVRRRNGGAAAALNTAVALATGEFVVQLDSDDVFLPRRLEAIADAIVARPDLDVVATDAFVEQGGKVLWRFLEAVPFAVERQRLAVLRHCFFAWPAMRRSRFVAVGGFDERYRATSDWAGFIRLVLDGALVGMVDEPLYRWRLGAGSISAEGAFNAAEEIRLLQQVSATYELTPDERRTIDEAVTGMRRRATLLRAKEAVADGGAAARRHSLEVALGPGFSPRTRAKAALAVASPGLARRALAGRFAPGTAQRRFGVGVEAS
ncbi:MAG TPA: glycosyltransferase family A protein [Gaiellaceae bacterium]|nr:glycosyltransferase family A protein [Gaiellaceae bacterium]